jgi:hypothetical protein
MRSLRQIVFGNFGLKLLALGISFSLWATYTAEPFAEVGYNVPLAFENVAAGLAIAGDVPTAVHVRIRGRSGLLQRLTPTDLSFNVDLGHARAGQTSVRLTPEMVGVPYGATVVRITPAEFSISLVPSPTPLPGHE